MSSLRGVDIPELAERLLAGQRRALARALTVVEGADPAAVRALVSAVHAHTGGAHRIGVTGSPGVGKSTLTSALAGELRGRGRRVAVLAVDPSSPFSGGALLGDRVRMGDHVPDDGVFIRSMATRGHLGGLAWAAPHALAVMEAAGFDVVIVETVGVGQAEVEIARLADTTLVVQAPGLGDAVQAAKAGILEIADLHVVNKADRPDASRTAREIESMLGMAPPSGWTPRVLRTTASTGEGVPALADAIDAHHAWATDSGQHATRRREAAAAEVREIVLAAVRRHVTQVAEGRLLADAASDVADRRQDPYTAADGLIQALGL